MNQSEKLTIRLLQGRQQQERAVSENIWVRFDRLQRSLRPLRKGQRIARVLHYGR